MSAINNLVTGISMLALFILWNYISKFVSPHHKMVHNNNCYLIKGKFYGIN